MFSKTHRWVSVAPTLGVCTVAGAPVEAVAVAALAAWRSSTWPDSAERSWPVLTAAWVLRKARRPDLASKVRKHRGWTHTYALAIPVAVLAGMLASVLIPLMLARCRWPFALRRLWWLKWAGVGAVGALAVHGALVPLGGWFVLGIGVGYLMHRVADDFTISGRWGRRLPERWRIRTQVGDRPEFAVRLAAIAITALIVWLQVQALPG